MNPCSRRSRVGAVPTLAWVATASLVLGACASGSQGTEGARAPVAIESVGPIDSAATTSTTAERGESTQATPVPEPGPFAPSKCDLDLVARLSASHRRARQFVVVLTSDFSSVSGTVQVVNLTGAGAKCRRAPMAAMLGRNGTRPLTDRRSGDGTTPAGVFPLGVVQSPQAPVSFFGNRADPGVRGQYRRVQPGDCYGATPNTSGYGHWRVVAGPSECIDPDEYLPSFVNSYAHAAIIGANTEPSVSGDESGEPPYAAAIFLHAHSYASDGITPKPVSGCVTLALGNLVKTLRLIDPGKRPVFAIGPRDFLLSA